MKKLLRIIVVLLILLVMFAVVFPQTELYMPALHKAISTVKATISLPESAEAVAQLAAKPPSASTASVPAQSSAVTSMPVPVRVPTIGMLGTETDPVVVKMSEAPPSQEQETEREKDREIQRSIARSTGLLASNSRIHNIALVLQAFFSFMLFVVFCMLLESVRKLASAAARIADATKTAAEAAAKTGGDKWDKRRKQRRFPPHFYHKR